MNNQRQLGKNRRRSCRDRWRYQRHQRRRTAANPATSAFLQLLTVIFAVFGRVPILPVQLPQPAPSPRPAPRRTDMSPEQIEREHGEGGRIAMQPRVVHGRYRVLPSYSRILRDLSRPAVAARVDAAGALLARVPMEALEWTYAVLREEDWAALRTIVQPGMSDAEADAALVTAAREALLRQAAEDAAAASTDDEDDGDDNDNKRRRRGR